MCNWKRRIHTYSRTSLFQQTQTLGVFVRPEARLRTSSSLCRTHNAIARAWRCSLRAVRRRGPSVRRDQPQTPATPAARAGPGRAGPGWALPAGPPAAALPAAPPLPQGNGRARGRPQTPAGRRDSGLRPVLPNEPAAAGQARGRAGGAASPGGARAPAVGGSRWEPLAALPRRP